MSRSRFYKLRKQKKLKKLQLAQNYADCQYAKIILSENKKFNCYNCCWFSRIKEIKDDYFYWMSDYCKNKYRMEKYDYRAELPEEKFCGFFKESISIG